MVLQKDPGSRQFLALAEEFRKEGEYTDAIRALENGLRYHPSYVAAHVSLGRVLKECGRPDEALKAFLNALKIDGENLVAIKQAGFLYAEQGDRVEAVKKFKRYRGLNPGDKEVAEQIERLDLELGTTSRLRPSSLGPDLAAPLRETATRPFFTPRPGLAPPVESPIAERAPALPGVEAPFGTFRVPPPLPRPAPGPISNPSLLTTEPLRPIETGPVQIPAPSGPSGADREAGVLEMSYDAHPGRGDGDGGKGERPPAAVPEIFLFDVEMERIEPDLPAPAVSEPLTGEGEPAWDDGDQTLPGGPARAPASDVLLESFAQPLPVTVAPEPRGEPRREIVTETLAELYLAQGLRAEARSAFDTLARNEADFGRAAAYRDRSRAIALDEAAARAADPRRERLEAYLRRVARTEEASGELGPVVEELVEADIGIETAILTETGGVPVVIAGRFGPAEESLAAELASFWKNLKRGSDDFEAGPPALVSLAADVGGAAVSGIGDGYALVLRTAPGSSLGRIRYRAARAVSRLRPLLA
jgi:tetratricopeptide (TPR) repeat protein